MKRPVILLSLCVSWTPSWTLWGLILCVPTKSHQNGYSSTSPIDTFPGPPPSPFLFLGHISYLTSLLTTINKSIKLGQLLPADAQRIVSQSEVLLFPLHKQSERERALFPSIYYNCFPPRTLATKGHQQNSSWRISRRICDLGMSHKPNSFKRFPI